MVKENLIIENKKPFEIVQEVNNEVPSFEEFMKTYEGGVNYDEFNYCGDIGMSKKYGPGEDWDWLCIPCPAMGCPETDRKTCKDWVHKRSSCRSPVSYMKWSTEARIKCSYCDNPSHIRNWTFKCHRHNEYLTLWWDKIYSCYNFCF